MYRFIEIPECIKEMPRFAANELFQNVCQLISDEMLKGMAEVDGHGGSEYYFEPLRDLRDSADPGSSIKWNVEAELKMSSWVPLITFAHSYANPTVMKDEQLSSLFCSILLIVRSTDGTTGENCDNILTLVEAGAFLKGPFPAMIRDLLLSEIEKGAFFVTEHKFKVLGLIISFLLEPKPIPAGLVSCLCQWLEDICAVQEEDTFGSGPQLLSIDGIYDHPRWIAYIRLFGQLPSVSLGARKLIDEALDFQYSQKGVMEGFAYEKYFEYLRKS